MNKNSFAVTPPMGWNSYDYYDTTVNEEQVKANADYMSANMKQYGWEYVVVDIEWYSYNAGTRRDEHQYIPFEKCEMDEYSRLQPCPQRFPSSVKGAGFKPLADYIHGLGLKFGIHIMRGIPRIAAHHHMSIMGTDITADEIADPSSICFWNPDMYGVRPDKEASQIYYNSIFQMYAEWGVDFVKCDDICRMDMPSAKAETEMLHKAIEACGRPIVFSLSPGPAKPEEAWWYEKYANMWRITDDFWDNWQLLLNMFERCEHWQNHVSEGCYPDCDMLPVGKLGKGFGEIRDTRFTKNEQITMMTLWCMFRSPMMIGAELTDLDEWTLSLLTKEGVLKLLGLRNQAKQLRRCNDEAVWINTDDETGILYAALFNTGDEERNVSFAMGEAEAYTDIAYIKTAKELWTDDNITVSEGRMNVQIPAHGAKLFKLK